MFFPLHQLHREWRAFCTALCQALNTRLNFTSTCWRQIQWRFASQQPRESIGEESSYVLSLMELINPEGICFDLLCNSEFQIFTQFTFILIYSGETISPLPWKQWISQFIQFFSIIHINALLSII